MSDQHAIENIKRYPEQMRKFVDAEIKLGHTWKNKKSLESIWNQCMDIDDISECDSKLFGGGDDEA